jgi:hypothetical protein
MGNILRTEEDKEQMYQMLAGGVPKTAVAAFFGCSAPTVSSRIDELRREESMLLAYDKVHYLDLISVKHRLLSAMTDEKIEAAPLGQIGQTYGIIAKMEQLIQGRPTEIHGLMGYLMHLEAEDREPGTSKNDTSDPENPPLDAEFTNVGCEQLSLFESL